MSCAAYVRGSVRETVRPVCGEVCGELCGIAVRASVRSSVRYRNYGLRWKIKAYAVGSQISPVESPRIPALRVPGTGFSGGPGAVAPVSTEQIELRFFTLLHGFIGAFLWYEQGILREERKA
jgi:hypothetical protein